jgi:hypothetical protein
MVVAEAQTQMVYKFIATQVAVREPPNDWSDWKACDDILVVLNLETERINIYSSTPQEYDIYYSTVNDDDGYGYKVIQMKAIDEDGIRCDLRLRNKRDFSTQLYIQWSNMEFVYELETK